MAIDIRTLILILGVSHLMQVVVFYLQYKVNKAYKGIGWWLMWSVAEVIGFTAMLFRGIPSILPIVIIVQNTAIVTGTLFIYIGVMRFFNKKENLKIIIPIFTMFMSVFLYFLFVQNDIQIRSILLSVVFSFVSFLTVVSLLKNKIAPIKTAVNFNAGVFIIHGSVFLYRSFMIITGTSVSDVFASSFFNIIPYFDALIVSLLWTFGFIIMLNQRLNAEMTEAKKDFELIFNTSPDAAVVTRISDGHILDINSGFTALTGFTREESVGKSSINMLWKNPDDRQKVIHELQQKGFCENFEAIFQRKDGTELVGLMSAKVITLQGDPYIISITRDITARKRAEEEQKKLLVDLQVALADIKTLSGLIPICSSCKKIRDDKGYWNILESYLMKHSDAKFTHGICPDCLVKLFPDYVSEKLKDQKKT
jgi:PAS domain S-box-containing protein